MTEQKREYGAVKEVKSDAIQYRLQEYADNPLTFDRTPEWLQKAIADGDIKPEFASEDYWYLSVNTPEGNFRIGPGDWIVYTRGAIYTFSDWGIQPILNAFSSHDPATSVVLSREEWEIRQEILEASNELVKSYLPKGELGYGSVLNTAFEKLRFLLCEYDKRRASLSLLERRG